MVSQVEFEKQDKGDGKSRKMVEKENVEEWEI